MISLSRKAAGLRCVLAAGLGVGALMTAAPSAHAYVYSSCGQWASWSGSGYTVYNDVWGASSGQCIYINSATSWHVTANFSGGGIKSYPHIQKGISLSYGSSRTCSFGASNGSGQWDLSFDNWTNAGDEIMIWENWTSGVGPAGSKKYSSVSINGATWNVYQGNVGHNCVSFLRTSHRNSGSENIGAISTWAHSHGLVGGSATTSEQFGYEITNTSGSQNFYLNSFSG